VRELYAEKNVTIQSPLLFFFKSVAGVRGGSSPPAGFWAAPQGFVFEFKQKAPFTAFDFAFCPKGIMSSQHLDNKDIMPFRQKIKIKTLGLRP